MSIKDTEIYCSIINQHFWCVHLTPHIWGKWTQFRTRTFTVLPFEIKPNIFQIMNRRNKTKGKLIFRSIVVEYMQKQCFT